ncbi:uncharacterized protein LOC62_03G003872 [Vanrija pseudolonga]|uniref:GATA-type domain-containing protein n=1 Tax=Vanrija pseudolonga TaxID=143232 RepID=A0AAF1BJX2_9TREE|nr:hypothetical protein LOC62_03G003872 [Vanrija pseudolonga]
MTRTPSPNGNKRQRKTPRTVRRGFCANCGCDETQTQLWRSNPDDPENPNNMLCNACGLWVKEKGYQRPEQHWKHKTQCRDPKGPVRHRTPSDDEDDAPPGADGAASSTGGKKQGGASKAVHTQSKATNSASASAPAGTVTAAAGKTRKAPARARATKSMPKAKAKATAPTPATAPAPAPAPTARLPTPEPEVEKLDAPAVEDDGAAVLAAATTLLAFDRRNAPVLTSSPSKKRSYVEDDNEHGQHQYRPEAEARPAVEIREVDFSASKRSYNPAWMGDLRRRTSGSYAAGPRARVSCPNIARNEPHTPQHSTYNTQHYTHRAPQYATPYTSPQAPDNGVSSYPTPQSVMETPDLRARTLEETPVMNAADWFFGGGGAPHIRSSPPPMALPESEYSRNRYAPQTYAPEYPRHHALAPYHQSAYNGARVPNYSDYELV